MTPKVAARLFWTWLVVRTVIWASVACWVLPNTSLDLAEWTSWGSQFAWGYPKHPPLSAWMVGVFSTLSPGGVWGGYLAGYLLVAVTLWAAWQVGLEFLQPGSALLGVLCLDGLIYFAGDGADFSNNLALNATWALTILFFIRSVRTGEPRWWLALGVAVGLGLLCKYTLGILLVPLAGYLHWVPAGRRHLRKPGPYLAALLALVLLAPHAIWVVRSDYSTISYALDRSVRSNWLGHLQHPAAFLIGQVLKLLPVVVILLPLLGRRKAGETRPETSPDSAILGWTIAGPFVLLLLLSLLTGCQLRDIWGSPCCTFVGVWLLVVAGTNSAPGLLWSGRLWATVAVGMLLFGAGKDALWPYLTHRPSRVQYPGRSLAEEVTRRWSAHCSGPLPIVAGEAWRTYNVCCYSEQRPLPYTSGAVDYCTFDSKHTPWASDADLNRRGGVFLWDATRDGDALPLSIYYRFPNAEVQAPIVLPYQTGAPVPPDRIGIAFLWPRDQRASR